MEHGVAIEQIQMHRASTAAITRFSTKMWSMGNMRGKEAAIKNML
jgi:hypothetical protein